MNPIPSAMTRSQWWSMIGVVVAAMVALSTLHARYVVPSIRDTLKDDMRRIVAEEVEQHRLEPMHNGSVSRGEFTATVAGMNQRLGRMENQMDQLVKQNAELLARVNNGK